MSGRTVSEYVASRQVFVRGLALIYAVAFASLYAQLPGLFGHQGLQPVDVFLSRAAQGAGLSAETRTVSDAAAKAAVVLPSLVWVHGPLGVPVDLLLEALCLLGLLLACLAAVQLPNNVCLAVLWMLYLSLQAVGQTFLSFQWDMLLLEVGWAAIWFAPSLPAGSAREQPNPGSLLLLRFVLFKLMFMSGVVKIQAECPTWLGLTACHYHFATQCIPTPVSWWLHQLPDNLLRAATAATLFIEIPAALLILAPLRPLRLLAAATQLLLQLLILISGNYAFFNLLTALLCLLLLDDGCLPRRLVAVFSAPPPKPSPTGDECRPKSAGSSVAVAAACTVAGGAVVLYGVRMFSLAPADSAAGAALQLRLRISAADLQQDVHLALLLLLPLAAAALLASLVLHAARAASLASPTRPAACARAAWAAAVLVAVSGTFLAGVPPLLSLDPSLASRFSRSLPAVSRLHRAAQHYSISSGYGLFRRMTGVGDARGEGMLVRRPEVVLEGSDDGSLWQEIRLRYTALPGRAPPLVAPHQPRLDWQMWFAALGSFRSSPWLLHLAYKLLRGGPALPALSLLDRTSPYLDRPPAFLRALRYEYDFTAPAWSRARTLPGQQAPAAASGSYLEGTWWVRKPTGMFLLPLSATDKGLEAFIASSGYPTNMTSTAAWPPLSRKRSRMEEQALEAVMLATTAARDAPDLVAWGSVYTTLVLLVARLIAAR